MITKEAVRLAIADRSSLNKSGRRPGITQRMAPAVGRRNVRLSHGFRVWPCAIRGDDMAIQRRFLAMVLEGCRIGALRCRCEPSVMGRSLAGGGTR